MRKKILIVTQCIDELDTNLSFFIGWIKEFQKYAEVIVITQKEGRHDIKNVHCLPRGKKKILWYWWFLLTFDYDCIFVHMTPILAALAITRKPIYLWYESRGNHWKLRLAIKRVQKIFSASIYGIPVETRKSVITGHGIDTEMFRPLSKHPSPMMVGIGRQIPEKRLKLLESISYEIGVPIEIISYVSHKEVPGILGRANLFLHASTTGLDKALLEAMCCCTVLSCSPYVDFLPEECRCTPETMAEKSLQLLKNPIFLREYVEKNHSLKNLIPTLIKEMSTS